MDLAACGVTQPPSAPPDTAGMGNQFELKPPSHLTMVAPPATDEFLTYPTGDPYVDHGTACDAKDPVHRAVWMHTVDDHCFLRPSQRQRLVGEFQANVLAAELHYNDALVEVRLDELLKKTPKESTWLAEIILDVIGVVAVPSIMRALNTLRASGEAALSEITADAAHAAAELRKISDKQLEAVIKQAVSTGKKAMPIEPDHAVDDEKTAHLMFLDRLSREAGQTFEVIRGPGLAGVTDTQLLVLSKAYRGDNGHSKADYKQALEGQLKRYVESGIATLGIAKKDVKERRPNASVYEPWEDETKAMWVDLPIGKRLALYRRDHIERPKNVGDHVYGFTGPQGATKDDVDRATKADRAAEFHFYKYVPQEFEEVASEQHVAHWHEPPAQHAVGPSELLHAEWVTP